MVETEIDYASKIKKGLAEKDMYQKDLADQLNVSIRMIQKYLKHEAVPALSKRIKMANIFNDPSFTNDDERLHLNEKAFVDTIEKEYGNDAKAQAEGYLTELSVLFAGGKLNTSDQEAVLSSMKSIIFDVQERKSKSESRK